MATEYTANNAPLRTFLEKMDQETVSFVTFCLDELMQITDTERSAQWMCASKMKAMALAQSLVHLSKDAKIAIKKVDPVYQLTARWESPIQVIR